MKNTTIANPPITKITSLTSPGLNGLADDRDDLLGDEADGGLLQVRVGLDDTDGVEARVVGNPAEVERPVECAAGTAALTARGRRRVPLSA
jgi:hypothetical protein